MVHPTVYAKQFFFCEKLNVFFLHPKSTIFFNKKKTLIKYLETIACVYLIVQFLIIRIIQFNLHQKPELLRKHLLWKHTKLTQSVWHLTPYIYSNSTVSRFLKFQCHAFRFPVAKYIFSHIDRRHIWVGLLEGKKRVWFLTKNFNRKYQQI